MSHHVFIWVYTRVVASFISSFIRPAVNSPSSCDHFLRLAWACNFFYSHIEVQTWCSLLLRVHVATNSFLLRQSQPLDSLNISKCARWRELKDEDEWSTWKYVSFKEALASAQLGSLFWHLPFMSMDFELLYMEYRNLQRCTSYRILSNSIY